MPGRRSGAAPGATAAPPTWSSTSRRAARHRRSGAHSRSRSRDRARCAAPPPAAGARNASRSPTIFLSLLRLLSLPLFLWSSRAFFGRRQERRLARQPLDHRGGRDEMIAEIALMVLLDLGQPVDVVRHHAGRARHALLGGVAHPVQPLERRPVAQVKARHGIERLALLLGVEKVVGAQALQRFLQRLGYLAEMPGRVFDLRPQFLVGRLLEPAAESRNRRQRGEDRKSTRLNSSHLVISYAVFCLKQKKTLGPFCAGDNASENILVVLAPGFII